MSVPTRWNSLRPPVVPPLRVVHDERTDAGSPYPKCSLALRGGARLADVLIAWGLYELFSRTGAVVPFLYILFADGLFQGQSVGKRMLGVRAVFVPTRTGTRHRDSVLRNAPLALVILLDMMPHPLGHAAFLGGAVIIGGVECWKVVRDPLGLRFGDVWAQTQVVDTKVVAGVSVLATPAVVTPVPEQWMSAAVERRGEEGSTGPGKSDT